MIQSEINESVIPRPDYVPKKDYELAMEGLKKFEEADKKRTANLNAQLAKLKESTNTSLIKLLGQKRYEKWQAYKLELREEAKKWPVEEKPSGKYSIGARMQEFFKANEMPIESMRKLAEERNKKFASIMKEHKGPVGETKPEKEVDIKAIVPKSNGCSPEQYRYPWPGSQLGFNPGNPNGYQVTHNHGINGQTGYIRAELNALIRNGDNYDAVHTTKHTQHGTWVHSGQGGILTAYILVKSLADEHEIHAFDEEWQWSSFYSHSENDIMFHVLNPYVTGWGRAELSDLRLSLNDDGHYHHYIDQDLEPGSFRWAVINSRGPVPANTWVFVRFGSSLSIDVSSDDYKANINVKTAWSIQTFFILCNG